MQVYRSDIASLQGKAMALVVSLNHVVRDRITPDDRRKAFLEALDAIDELADLKVQVSRRIVETSDERGLSLSL